MDDRELPEGEPLNHPIVADSKVINNGLSVCKNLKYTSYRVKKHTFMATLEMRDAHSECR